MTTQTSNISTLQSLIGGRWLGKEAHVPLPSAIDSKLIYHTHAETIDFDAAVIDARTTGVPALMALDFQTRAARLKALAAYLMGRKEALYAIFHHTGATRPDSWIDIEGGIGTLFAFASMGSRALPSSNVRHEGPAIAPGKRGGFAGTHILVPRGGLAVHINAFNFPVWGLLEKFAPSFLAAMPAIGKPATSTNYLTSAVVRMMMESGLLPEGSLQLIIGSTGDLLDRLNGADVVTFTGSADTALTLRANKNLLANPVPFTAEADSLNCAVLGPDVTPDDPEFELFVKEVARAMTGKAGRKCTAIRRIIVPQTQVDAVAERLRAKRAKLAKIVVGDPSMAGVQMGALASMDQHRAVGERLALLADGNEIVSGARDGFAPVGIGCANGAFFAPTLLLCRAAMRFDVVHDVEAFDPVSTLMTYCGIDDAIALAARAVPGLAACWCSSAKQRSTRPATARPRRSSSTATRAAPAAARSSAACARCTTFCSAPPSRARRRHGRIRARRRNAGKPTSPVPQAFRGCADGRLAADAPAHRRTVTEADIVAFGCVSGDFFYLHFDEIAATDSLFGKRIAHGARRTATACCRPPPDCSCRRRPVPCWPTMASTPCVSSPRWQSATPSARA